MLTKTPVISVQIRKVFYPFIIAKAKDGHYLYLNLSATERKDTVFWEVMLRISQANLWVPIDKNTYQLLEYDWLEDE
ncbi:hypothetical protein LQF61_03350 [Tetragenococcus koreensis]|uniref:Uncharacterized protein n=1 Tax=Tetragenococcus koreensis TaxID=290335 RepID=A0AAN4UCR6_9ENTE|nr:hypothetical protein [Tetragenococcus koreensis]MDN6264454.1 hypothetical protein [Tetragenococcus halophilus]AYW46606.1 hypothetical protein C7K43_12130 [Tetragenococcus koreensis]MCF1585787.1 hypothetical protein [Tetragenococcus koreensis]MCF1615379.1 hypothetical protein [Tetragenococcus koreensis]MCF1617982.1 hypothetical protein [Tetragenococcus koreensis]